MMNRWFLLTLVAVTVATGATIVATAGALPDPVATHFDYAGTANGWMSHTAYLVFALAMGVGVPWLAYVLAALLPLRFPRLAKLRHGDYWLAPERLASTRAAIGSFAAGIAILLSVLGMVVHLMIVAAHAGQPPALPSGPFLAMVATFVVATLGIAIAFHLRFTPPPETRGRG